MLCIAIDSLCLLYVPRKYQAALAEEGLPCVLIACNCSLMENTNATCKKAAHLRLVQLLFPADKAKRHTMAHTLALKLLTNKQGVIDHKLLHNLAT